MALNPFFLQGASSEQRLVQDLINEQLKIYGVEITYIPRKFVRKQTIIEEVQSSKFDDNYSIEAYVNTYDGYSGAGDILTKFGMSLKDEVTLTISKERFEDFISPFLAAEDDGTGDSAIVLSTRPREGDLIYFPLGQRLFEVKFVEHEQPFYQLGKNYVYELKCELFEYEDEVIDTSIDEIDTQIETEGFITTLNLIGVGRTATAESVVYSGYIKEIFLNNDGYNYTSTPIVTISPLYSNQVATAVAITTNKGGSLSVASILLTNAGVGYTVAPTITISGGGGSGAAATCSIESTAYGVVRINLVDQGTGYVTPPMVTVGGPPFGGIGTATAFGSINTDGEVDQIYITNPGSGYTSNPTITIANPSILTGIGTYHFNEIVEGSQSRTQARVKSWDVDTNILKVSFVGIGSTTRGFVPGEIIVGAASSARYSVKSYDNMDIYDAYAQNDEIEEEADTFLDFSESNPFGNY